MQQNSRQKGYIQALNRGKASGKSGGNRSSLAKKAYRQPGITDNYGLLVLALETNSIFLPAHSRLALASPQHPSSVEASKRPILEE